MDDGDGREHPEVTPIRYGVFDSTVGDMVRRVYGDKIMSGDRDDLVDVMEAVVDAFDALERMKRIGWSSPDGDSWSARRARIVEYLRDGGRMSELHEDDELCQRRVLMSWDDVIGNLCHRTRAQRPSRIPLMTELHWYRFENACDEGELMSRPLARELGLSLSSVQNLARMYAQAGRCSVRV